MTSCASSSCGVAFNLQLCVQCNKSVCGRHRRRRGEIHNVVNSPTSHGKRTEEEDKQCVCTACIVHDVQNYGLLPHERIKYAPTNAMSPWVSTIAVVTFDLQLGQIVEFMYPPIPFSVDQEAELAFASFPDANTKGDEDTIHNFAYSWRYDQRDDARRMCYRRQTTEEGKSAPPPEFGGAECPPQTFAVNERGFVDFFGMSLFHQKKDPTIPRGALQKSVFLLSSYPYPSLCHGILKAVLADAFQEGADVSKLPEIVVHAYQQISSWPKPCPGVAYSLPILTSVLEFITPSTLPFETLGWSIPEDHDDDEYLVSPRSAARFMAPPTLADEESEDESPRSVDIPALRRGLRDLQDYITSGTVKDDDVNLLVHTLIVINKDFTDCFTSHGWNLSTASFDTPLSREELQGILEELKHRTEGQFEMVSPKEANTNRDSMLAPLLASHSDNPNFLSSCDRKLEEVLKDLIKTAQTLPKRDQCPPLSPIIYHTLQDVSLHSALYQNVGKTWKLWEMVMMGEPIGVFGPDAASVSFATLAIASLVAPLKFQGILRPYVTINSKELDVVFGRVSQSDTLLGCCNPFFVRHFSSWPHFLSMGASTLTAVNNKDGSCNKTQTTDSEKREKLQFKLRDALFSSRIHFTTKTDLTVANAVIKWDANKCFIQNPSTSYVPHNILREHFAALTQDFLKPIQDSIRDILFKEQPFFLSNADIQKIVSVSAINQQLNAHYSASRARFKEGRTAEIYTKFFRTSMFKAWLTEQFHVNFRLFVLSCTHVSRILDCTMSPNVALEKWVGYYKIEVSRPCVDVVLVDRMTQLSIQLLELCNIPATN